MLLRCLWDNYYMYLKTDFQIPTKYLLTCHALHPLVYKSSNWQARRMDFKSTPFMCQCKLRMCQRTLHSMMKNKLKVFVTCNFSKKVAPGRCLIHVSWCCIALTDSDPKELVSLPDEALAKADTGISILSDEVDSPPKVLRLMKLAPNDRVFASVRSCPAVKDRIVKTSTPV